MTALILRSGPQDRVSKGLRDSYAKIADNNGLILRACESFDFGSFRHELNQGLSLFLTRTGQDG